MTVHRYSPKPQNLKFEWPKHLNRYFETPLFPATVYFVTSREDFYAIERYMKQRELFSDEELEGAGGATAHYLTNHGLVVVIGVFDENGVDVLCHEVCHATFFILERVGHRSDAENSEPFCYMAQWLLARGEAFVQAAQKVAIEEGRLVPADHPDAVTRTEEPLVALSASVRSSKGVQRPGGRP